MSVPIHCPDCGEQVDTTAWGHDLGEFRCIYCDIEFERFENDAGGVSIRRLN